MPVIRLGKTAAVKTTRGTILNGGACTGLGLVICKKIAEAHGGRILAESRIGEGTTFTLEIRIDESECFLNDSGSIST